MLGVWSPSFLLQAGVIVQTLVFYFLPMCFALEPLGEREETSIGMKRQI